MAFRAVNCFMTESVFGIASSARGAECRQWRAAGARLLAFSNANSITFRLELPAGRGLRTSALGFALTSPPPHRATDTRNRRAQAAQRAAGRTAGADRPPTERRRTAGPPTEPAETDGPPRGPDRVSVDLSVRWRVWRTLSGLAKGLRDVCHQKLLPRDMCCLELLV